MSSTWKLIIVAIGATIIAHILIQHIIEPRIQAAKNGGGF